MKRFKLTLLYALFLLLCFDGALSAQLPSWQWGKRGGGSNGGTVTGLATDRNGNIYVLSGYPSLITPDVDGHPALNNHTTVTVASFDCNGHFRWMKSFGGGSASIAFTIGTDSLGGVYVIGGSISLSSAFGGPNYLDTDTIIPYDNKMAYLIKYDTSGNFQWIRRPEPDNMPVGALNPLGFSDMAVSPSGDIYLFGYIFPGTFADGAFSITTGGYYVVQYNRHGQFQQVIPLDMQTSSNDGNGGRGNMSSAHFSRDNHNGRFYISGYYISDHGTLKFGNTNIVSEADMSRGGLIGWPSYLAAFDSSGYNLWVKQSSPEKNTVNKTPATFDGNGNVYFGGTWWGGTVFGGDTVSNLLGIGGCPVLVAVDSNGNNLWLSNGSSPAQATLVGIQVTWHSVAVSGRYAKILKWDTLTATTTSNNPNRPNTYFIMARFNAATGDIISLDSLVSNSFKNQASGLVSDDKGNLYLGGKFSSQLFPGNDTLTSIGGDYDWFVAKFGWEHCNCEVPVPGFSASGGANFGMSFTYSGSTANSYEWDFGDGSSPGSGSSPSHTYPHAGSYRVCVTASNSCGSNNTCRTITVGTTGIGEIPGFADVQVYPNPATQTLTISGASSGTRLGIYDALGRLMLNKTLKGGKDRIDVRQLSAGIYIMRFTDKEGRRGNVKFVKE